MNLHNLCMLSLMIYSNNLFTAGNYLPQPSPQKTRQLHHVQLSFGDNNIPGVTVIDDNESPAPTMRRKSDARLEKEGDVVRKLSPSPQPTGCFAWCCCSCNCKSKSKNQVSKLNKPQ